MKHLFVLIFLVSTLNLFAQDASPTQKGNLMLGGGGSIGYGFNSNEVSTGSFSLSPSIGFFLSDGFALGFAPSLIISSTKNLENRRNYLTFGIDIFIVKYFSSGLFIRGSFGYDLAYSNDSDPDSPYHSSDALNIIPEVGYAFFLGPNAALELSLKDIFRLCPGDDPVTYSNTTRVSVGFQIFL